MNDDNLTLDIRDHVARLTLNRPDKLNALSYPLLAELRAALKQVIASKEARVLLITGSGRGFCAGLDLTGSREGLNPEDRSEPLRDYFLPVFSLLRELTIPTIAAVNGPAIGAGLALALSCDITVAARSAYFTCAFVNIGLVTDCGASSVIYRKIGESRTAGLLLLGEKLPADKAAEWGLIWKCVEDDRLVAEVDAMAAKFATGPTLAYGLMRRLVQKAPDNSYKQQLDLEMEYQVVVRDSADAQEARKAFAEKRPPVFRGR